MASTIPANIDPHPRTHPTSRSSSAREPRLVRSILLSAPTGPPGLHARDGRGPSEPTVSLNSDAQDGLASALNPNAPLQPKVTTKPVPVPAPVRTPDPDVKPPSIHLSENPTLEDEDEPEPARAINMAPPPVSVLVSAPRARRTTLDLPSSPIDLYSTDHKLALEGTSPKPCIVPGNALHLIDDDPTAPRSATPTSVIIVGDESEHGAEPETDPDFDGDGEGEVDAEGEYDDAGGEAEGEADGVRRSASQPPGSGTVRPGPRVRFRSRVRITSGVHRHRHGVSATGGGSTPGSTTSDSPSSSISAPLRYQADENAAWGPIGKRLSGYAAVGGWQRRAQAQVQVQTRAQNGEANGTRDGAMRGRGRGRGARGYNERTPLLRPPPGGAVHSEDELEDSQRMSEAERTMRASALRREEEAVFGKWPWRIFNRHWWWWHVEPVFCCCADDSDYEDV